MKNMKWPLNTDWFKGLSNQKAVGTNEKSKLYFTKWKIAIPTEKEKERIKKLFSELEV